MTARQFLLDTSEAKKITIEAINNAPPTYVCVLKPRNRTTEQNALYWKILTEAENSTFRNDGKIVSKESWHHYFKKMFLEPIEIPLPNGKTEIVYKSTTKLTVNEFIDFIDKIFCFFAEIEELNFICEYERELVA